MGVFRRHYRTVAAFAACLLKPCGAHILRHIHVGVPFPEGALVVHRTVHAVFLLVFKIEVSIVEVVAVASFVAERPDRHRGMVLVALIHVFSAVHMGLEPFGIVAERAALAQVVVHAVAFDVCLVVDIQAVFVAEVIEFVGLRIVAEAHGVYVVLLHQLEVLAHEFLGHVVAGLGVVLVDIHALELNGLAVDKEAHVWHSFLALFAVLLYLEAAEAHIVGNHLGNLSGSVFKRDEKAVEVRSLRCPGCHILYSS